MGNTKYIKIAELNFNYSVTVCKAIIIKDYGTTRKKWHRPVKLNKEPRDKLTHIYSTNLWQGSQKYSVILHLKEICLKREFPGGRLYYTIFYVLVTYSTSIYTFLKGFKMVSRNLGSI